MKIQIEDKQFSAFSFVNDHDSCVDSCSRESVDDWIFWTDTQIAIHRLSSEALQSLSEFPETSLKWCWKDEGRNHPAN